MPVAENRGLFMYKIIDFVMKIFGKIKWDWIYAKFNKGRYFKLTGEEWSLLHSTLSDNYCIILTWRSTHLSSYLVSISNFFTRGSLGVFSHALMNLEADVIKYGDFRLIEATSSGVGYSKFVDVFNCDRVCLLRPKGITPEEWTFVMDALKAQDGKSYDSVYDFQKSNRLSCTELVWMALKHVPNYEDKFKHFYNDIVLNKGRILPDDFMKCKDFEIIMML